jgi:predicted helicase
MESENLAFLTHRPQSPKDFTYAYCTTMIGDQNVAANKTGGGGNSFQFPLYLYTTPEETAGTLFAQLETTRRPNLAPAFISAFSEKLGLQFIQDGEGDLKKKFGPEDVFYYAYAVFHSPTYRTRYAEFLKIDFPRLPLTSDKMLFAKLAGKGKELVELHLLRSGKVDDFITTWPEAGDNKVEKVAYASGKVYINTRQYFGKLPEDVWEFKVGGYQVCEKWLKDRKGRVLSKEDINHYQRVVVALKETNRLMKEIDEAIVKWPLA